MIPRILEPELMDTIAEAMEYDAMDHSMVNRIFIEDFLQRWNGQSPILDIGTGTALIPIEFCRQSPQGELIAIDLANQMLLQAHANLTHACFTHRVHLMLVDAKMLPFADRSLPNVMSNSIIHHIPEPAFAIREIVRVTAPGGLIFVRDLMRPDSIDELERIVETYTQGATAHQRRLFHQSLYAALTLNEVHELITTDGFAATSVQATSDRHWTWSAIQGT